MNVRAPVRAVPVVRRALLPGRGERPVLQPAGEPERRVPQHRVREQPGHPPAVHDPALCHRDRPGPHVPPVPPCGRDPVHVQPAPGRRGCGRGARRQPGGARPAQCPAPVLPRAQVADHARGRGRLLGTAYSSTTPKHAPLAGRGLARGRSYQREHATGRAEPRADVLDVQGLQFDHDPAGQLQVPAGLWRGGAQQPARGRHREPAHHAVQHEPAPSASGKRVRPLDTSRKPGRRRAPGHDRLRQRHPARGLLPAPVPAIQEANAGARRVPHEHREPAGAEIGEDPVRRAVLAHPRDRGPGHAAGGGACDAGQPHARARQAPALRRARPLRVILPVAAHRVRAWRGPAEFRPGLCAVAPEVLLGGHELQAPLPAQPAARDPGPAHVRHDGRVRPHAGRADLPAADEALQRQAAPAHPVPDPRAQRPAGRRGFFRTAARAARASEPLGAGMPVFLRALFLQDLLSVFFDRPLRGTSRRRWACSGSTRCSSGSPGCARTTRGRSAISSSTSG